MTIKNVMEIQLQKFDPQWINKANNFLLVCGELPVQGTAINNNRTKNEIYVTNENVSRVGREIRKSVSWAEDKDLVETREIEIQRPRSLTCRILDCLCCISKSEKKY